MPTSPLYETLVKFVIGISEFHNIQFFPKDSSFIIMMQLALQPRFGQQVAHEKL